MSSATAATPPKHARARLVSRPLGRRLRSRARQSGCDSGPHRGRVDPHRLPTHRRGLGVGSLARRRLGVSELGAFSRHSCGRFRRDSDAREHPGSARVGRGVRRADLSIHRLARADIRRRRRPARPRTASARSRSARLARRDGDAWIVPRPASLRIRRLGLDGRRGNREQHGGIRGSTQQERRDDARLVRRYCREPLPRRLGSRALGPRRSLVDGLGPLRDRSLDLGARRDRASRVPGRSGVDVVRALPCGQRELPGLPAAFRLDGTRPILSAPVREPRRRLVYSNGVLVLATLST